MMKRRLTYAKVLNGSEAVLHQTLILENTKGQLPTLSGPLVFIDIHSFW